MSQAVEKSQGPFGSSLSHLAPQQITFPHCIIQAGGLYLGGSTKELRLVIVAPELNNNRTNKLYFFILRTFILYKDRFLILILIYIILEITRNNWK